METPSDPFNKDQATEGWDERIVQFLNAWKVSRQGSLVPLKDDIDPGSIPRLLSNVWLYQYDPSISDFVCRLAGEDVNIAWGRRVRGLPLGDMISRQHHRPVLDRWRQVVDVPQIEYSTVLEHPHTGLGHHTERLILPLASKPDRRDYVFGISLYRMSQASDFRATATAAVTTTISCDQI